MNVTLSRPAKLVVFLDDNLPFRQTLSDTGPGFNVNPVVCGSIDEVLTKLRVTPEASFVSDIRMPGVSGIAALKEVRQAFPEIQIYAMSSFDLTEDETAALVELEARFYDKRHAIITLMEDLGGVHPSQDTSSSRQETPDQPEIEAESSPERRTLELQEQFENLKSLSRDFVDILLKDLDSLPDQSSRIGEPGESFTVAELREDILNLTPRGMKYIALWRDAMEVMNRYRAPSSSNAFRTAIHKLWHNISKK